MGMKPVSFLCGFFAAGLLLTGCETSGSKRPVAQSPQQIKPYAGTSTGTPTASRPGTSWDNSRVGPPPSPNYNPSPSSNVVPASYTAPGSGSPGGSSAPSLNDGVPVGNSRNGPSAGLGAPEVKGATKPSAPAQPTDAANSPPTPEPALMDTKNLTPPPPPGTDGQTAKSVQPPSLQSPGDLKPTP